MSRVSVAVTGQALLHGQIGVSAAGEVSRLFWDSDAAFANLEATIETPGAWPTKTKTLHLLHPSGVRSLAELGLRGLTHANNHAFDLGPPGIARTRAVISEFGLHLSGSGRDAEEAALPIMLDRGGAKVAVLSVDLGPQPEIVYAGADRAGINPLRLQREVTLAEPDFDTLRRLARELGDDKREAARTAVGYQAPVASGQSIGFFGTRVQPGPATTSRFVPLAHDLAALSARIVEARQQADVVAVALHGHHWDGDWTRTPGWMLDLCRSLIDRGAELVVGTGAPVLQPIAFHRGKPILAGLGNFIFHTGRSSTYDRAGVPVWTGAVIRCHFDLADRDCTAVEVLPITVGRPPAQEGGIGLAPVPLEAREAERVFAFLTANLSDDERTRVSRVSRG
jgi:poly-gamma-glutamate capsule biosynthesis protein CapA/YwtB (metallophosphatase superfamily)